MTTLLAPYHSSMRLGSGFNSYTQQLCVDHSVIADDSSPVSKDNLLVSEAEGVAQSVTYKTTMIDKVSDVTNALNINGAVSIKAGALLDGTGNGEFVNSDKIKESTVSFLISVKVVNQVIMDSSLTKFSPITGVSPLNFTKVYGDSFISGFQEGGEFNALITIKSEDSKHSNNLAVNAAITLTNAVKGIEGNAEGHVDKTAEDIMKQNETSISVSWTGGGQNLKEPGQDWTLETLKAAAIKFPELVAKTPMRTHAVLTRYTSLRTFQAMGEEISPLVYENVGGYTTILQDAYLDYKNLYKTLQLLGNDVDDGLKNLGPAKVVGQPGAPKLIGDGKTPETEDNVSGVVTPVSSTASYRGRSRPTPRQPLQITGPYPCTLSGLESAKRHIRYMMNRIVDEVDIVTSYPEIATDENWPMPVMNPLIFKQYLPTPVSVVAKN